MVNVKGKNGGVEMGKTFQRVVELLKKEFEEKKVSKYAFCKKTGINPTSVDRYLHGISEPNQSSLEKLSEYFGVPVWWLRGEGHDIEKMITESFLSLNMDEVKSSRMFLLLAGRNLLSNIALLGKTDPDPEHEDSMSQVVEAIESLDDVIESMKDDEEQEDPAEMKEKIVSTMGEIKKQFIEEMEKRIKR